MPKKILLTGVAGFIGFRVAQLLLQRGDDVIGIDNLNDYYDVSLKEARRDILLKNDNFTFHPFDIVNMSALNALFDATPFDRVIHLAAQAGVRYSITNPSVYIQSNLLGFANILEACRHHQIPHLSFASSSSVYGANREIPFAESQKTDRPVSLYGATKKANELLAYSYAHLYNLPCTGLRFFTVYGPWGRPDMAVFSFTEKILGEQPIDVYNFGNMRRDFTYIDDIAEGVIRVSDSPPNREHSNLEFQDVPFRVYNIGNHEPVELSVLIETLERHLGKSAIKNYIEMQSGDVLETYADTAALQRDFGFKPYTSLDTGIANFVAWYKKYRS
ncbi:MAG: NAD-dependent epimerase [Thermoguttaceae bacterium]